MLLTPCQNVILETPGKQRADRSEVPTHRPGGLRYEDGVVQCPWHNSRFDVCTGENLDWVTGFAGHQVPR